MYPSAADLSTLVLMLHGSLYGIHDDI